MHGNSSPLGNNRLYPDRGYIIQPPASPGDVAGGNAPWVFCRWLDLIPVGRPVADNSARYACDGGAKNGGHGPPYVRRYTCYIEIGVQKAPPVEPWAHELCPIKRGKYGGSRF